MVVRNSIPWVVASLALTVSSIASAQPALTANPQAHSALACYRWVPQFPNERYKLDIRFHSALTERKEEEATGHPKQAVFSVHGKHVGVCGVKLVGGEVVRTVRPVVGTLVSVSPLGQPGGARLGLETFATTGGPGAQFCKDVEISCKAEVTTAVAQFPPPVWNCFSQNKHPVEHLPSQLILVNELVDPLCSEFENGQIGPPRTDCDATGLERVGQPPC